MNALRIAFYMHDLSGGGVERMRLSLISELRSRGAYVVLIVGQTTGALASMLPSDLPVIQLGSARTYRSILPLARVMRRLRPDFLIASLNHNNLTAMTSTRLACVNTRVVICQHNTLSAETDLGWKYRVLPWLYWLFRHRAHGIVAVSNGVADDFAKTTSISRTRITRIYNPIIGSDFASRAESSIDLRQIIKPEGKTLIFVGRLTEQKNPALLLDAFALLDGALQAQLIILGEGPLLSTLELQASRLGVTDRVHFCGFQANPLTWIKQADCLVLTSRYEGFGNVLIEALACGTPVVSTDCLHGPREALADGAFGELVPCDNPRRLADAITRTVHQTPDPARLRRRASDFTSSVCADEHLALFARIELSRDRQARPFGLDFTTLTAAGIVETICGQAVKERLRLVVTPNIDHVRLLRQTAFRAAYKSADLICPDGFPVLAYARLKGLPLHARVTGCELVKGLANTAAFARKRVTLVVESKSTEVAARTWASARGLINLSVFTAPAQLGANETAQLKLVAAIKAARPEILIMTLGAPVSEVFIHHHRCELPPCWALCVGQALRVHLGLTKRAPVSWQKRGLEWLWRLIQEPRRLAGRYTRSSLWFGVAVLRDIMQPPPARRPVPLNPVDLIGAGE